MKKLMLTIIALTVATVANAGNYTVKVPLEVAQGGTLPNGSIKFTNASVVEPETPPVVEPETPEENGGDVIAQCNAEAALVNDFLNLNYPDVNYISHLYGPYKIGPHNKVGCVVNIEAPKSKGYHCVGSNTYINSVISNVRAAGVKAETGFKITYYGVCN